MHAATVLATWRSSGAFGPPRDFKSGTRIFSEGDSVCYAFLIAHGAVGVVRSDASGREALVTIRCPGQIVDVCSHPPGCRYSFSAHALVASALHVASLGRVRDAILKQPRLARLESDALRSDLIELAMSSARIQLLSPHERLEGILRLLAEAAGDRRHDGSLQLVLTLTNAEMACLSGICESRYKSVRAELEKRGGIRREGARMWVVRPRPGRLARDQGS